MIERRTRPRIARLILSAVLLTMLLGIVSWAQDEAPAPARSVILMIGDGMGDAQRTAARWATVGIDGELNMDQLDIQDGWTKTDSALGLTTDSAAAATAIASGVKTLNGFIGLGPLFEQLTTIAELAQAAGKSVGLVTTVPITQATAAGFAAHVVNRSLTGAIAEQLLDAEIDLLLGGGETDFLPFRVAGVHTNGGLRTDGSNLIEEAKATGYRMVYTAEDLASLDPAVPDPILGLFASGGLEWPFSPTLAEMTRTAIEYLDSCSDGFFLMVEAGQIDWACHDNDAQGAIDTTLGFDDAVGVALEYVSQHDDALLIVTADHETGGMSVSTALSGDTDEDGPFALTDDDAFFVSWSTESHTSTDVPVLAQGPGAAALSGVHENTWIFDVMINASGLPDPRTKSP